jgi:hypothetical protein
MVIDLPSSSQSSLRGNLNPTTQVLNQRQDALQVALKALNLRAGDTFTALVKAVTPVNEALRARLIQLTTPVSESSDSQTTRRSTASTELASLLKTAGLKLVQLELSRSDARPGSQNPTLTQLVFSDQALKANQQLKVSVEAGRLVLAAPQPSVSETSGAADRVSVRQNDTVAQQQSRSQTASSTPSSPPSGNVSVPQTDPRVPITQLASLQKSLTSVLTSAEFQPLTNALQATSAQTAPQSALDLHQLLGNRGANARVLTAVGVSENLRQQLAAAIGREHGMSRQGTSQLQRLLSQPQLQLAVLAVKNRPVLLPVVPPPQQPPLQSGQEVALRVADAKVALNWPAPVHAGRANTQPTGVQTSPSATNPPSVNSPPVNPTTTTPQTAPTASSSTSSAFSGHRTALPVEPGSASAIDTRAADAKSPASPTAAKLDAQQLTTLQTALRQLLPQQQQLNGSLSRVLQVSQEILQILQQPSTSVPLPREDRVALQSVRGQLQTLASHLRTYQQLSNPTEFRQALKGTGMQLEHQLAQLVRQDSSSSGAKGLLPPSSQPSLPQLDLKAALLNLLHGLPAPQHPLVPGTPVGDLLPLLRQLLAPKQAPGDRPTLKPEANQNIPQQLQQLVSLSLNKLLLQQLQALQSRQASPEATHNWQLEIPIRYGAETQQLQLRLEEQWLPDPKEQSQREVRKVRQWQVKLAFDLPDAGAIHAHLNVIEDRVGASLWAEKPWTLAQAKQRLEQLKHRLEEDGVAVTKLECLPGRPSEDQTRLNYSLVDIRT